MIKNILYYIPLHQQKIVDYQEIAKVIELYTDKIYKSIDTLNSNRAILTADVDTIRMWEKRLGLDSSGTLDERRNRVWINLTAKVPFTEQWLRQWLNSLTRRNTVYMDYDAYKCTIRIAVEDTDKLPTILSVLNIVMPAHIEWQVIRETGETIVQKIKKVIYKKLMIKEHIGYGQI